MKNIPENVLNLILQRLPTPELYHLISGKTSAIQVIHSLIPDFSLNDSNLKSSQEFIEDILRMVRTILFTRRGEEASRYQNAILGAWLIHSRKKLSFIENHADKKEWLRLLDEALKDPLSSFEHKIRCYLFINTLFPDTEDITPLIRQSIFTNCYEEMPVADILKAFSSEFSSNHVTAIINILWAQLDDYGSDESNAAAQSLGAITHRATQTQCDSIIGKLLSQTITRGTPTVLKEIAPYASRTQIEKEIALLLSIMGCFNEHRFVKYAHATAAIIAIGPYASEAECDDALMGVLRKLNNDVGGLVADDSGFSLGPLLANASKAQRDKIISLVVRKLGNTRWFDQQDIVFIFAIVPHLMKSQADALIALLITQLITQLNDESWYGRRNAARNMAAILPHATRAQSDQMITSLLAKLNDATAEDEDLYAVANALSGMAPHVSQSQCDAMMSQLQPKSHHPDASVRRAAALALSALAPHASKSQAERIIDPLLDNILNDIVTSVRLAATKALSASAAHASEAQLNTLITALLPDLDLEPTLGQSSVSTLIASAPYLTVNQLKRLLELPGESNLNKMVLKFAIQTRLRILEINQADSNPGTQSGLYFERNARPIDDSRTDMTNENNAHSKTMDL